MKIGFVGLGKLGLPCAVAIAEKGHEVMGYDVNPALMNKSPRPYLETGPDGRSEFNPRLARSAIRFGSLEQVAEHSEILFVAVQTPHKPEYEGITRLTERREDFGYDHLVSAVRALVPAIRKDTAVVIVSTVLPGTVRERVLPVVQQNPHIKLCYNPYFIAMGTTMRDFLYPEFVLFGIHDAAAGEKAKRFYRTITDAPFYCTSIENAELIKVAYNTFIGMKVVFANVLMEICHKTPGTSVDAVTDALKLGSRRIISGSYFSGGMGDGGGCHPRDNIAMSWLARKLGLSFNWFDQLMLAREKQTEWLADLMCAYDLPKAILGYSYKPETNITVGSPALLLKNILDERGVDVQLRDPHADGPEVPALPHEPMVFLIGARHPEFTNYRFPKGSVVIDPWRYLTPPSGVTYIPVGNPAGVQGEAKVEYPVTLGQTGSGY